MGLLWSVSEAGIKKGQLDVNMAELIVFDIDGTLADPSHRLHHILESPKDWDAFFEACDLDAPIWEGVDVAFSLYQCGFDLEFWTGRPERIRLKTREWLTEYVGEWSRDRTLRMRSNGDYRPDTEVKPEFLGKADDDPYIIFEDRDGVVQTFRELGYTVYQVTKGDY